MKYFEISIILILLFIFIFLFINEIRNILFIKKTNILKNINKDINNKELKIEFKKIYKAQNIRIFNGNSKGNIKMPFFRLSLFNRTSYQRPDYVKYISGEITLLNKNILFNTEISKWKYYLINIDNYFIKNRKEISLTFKKGFPIKIKFYSNKDLLKFFNFLNKGSDINEK